MAEDQQAWDILGNQFINQYYTLFDSLNKDALLTLYHPNAMMTFENSRVVGHDGIRKILTEKIRFETIHHAVTKADCQPTPEDGVLILVTGQLKTDADPPHAFSQAFYIKPANNSYFIFHDVFRLSIHNA